MATEIFSRSEREKLKRVPEDFSADDLIAFFTLSEADRRLAPETASLANRLGAAFQLCCLRLTGFYPDPPYGRPLEFAARQLDDFGLIDINQISPLKFRQFLSSRSFHRLAFSLCGFRFKITLEPEDHF